MSYRGGGRGRGYGGGGGSYGGGGGGGRGGPSGGTRIGPRDLEFMAELFDRETRDDSKISCMALEPASNLLFVGYASGVVRQWECADWANPQTGRWSCKRTVPMGSGGPVTALHIVGDPNNTGYLFVGCMTSSKVVPNQPPSPAVVLYFSTLGTGSLQGHMGKVDAVTSGGAAKYYLWTSGIDRTIRGWTARPDTGGFEQEIQFDGMSAVKLECVGDLLVASNNAGSIAVFHVPTKTRVQEFKAHDSAISGLLFAEGHLFTSSLDKKIRIWGILPEAQWSMNNVINPVPVMEQSGGSPGSRREYAMIIAMALMKDLNQRHVVLASYAEQTVRIFRPEQGRFNYGGFMKDNFCNATVLAPGPVGSGVFFYGTEKGRVCIWRFRAGVAAEEGAMDG